jgi:MFS transporter, ACS family, hexuronate transporter
MPRPRAHATKDRIRWIDLFRYRQLWVLLAAKFLTDAVWFFFIF